ncbi:MAG: 16S rRNA (cytosine(1402)-N(4))-methyltransferase RsmH [Nitrospinota bacterium]
MLHIPVLLDEVINQLQCQQNRIYVDATLGDGGHAEEILKKSSPSGILIGIDRDEDSIRFAEKRLYSYRERVFLFRENFRNIKNVINKIEIYNVDGVLFDLGVSTRQFMIAERGFSFSRDAPLDMRMDRSDNMVAEEIINDTSEEQLRDIIWKYGEERWAGRIARSIIREREKMPIKTTFQLAKIVFSAIPPAYRSKRIHPATKTFQSIRIAVNNEIEILKDTIRDAIDILNPGGRICVISYHSLEDRIVKNLFRELERGCICPPALPICVCGRKGIIKIVTKRHIAPSEDEIKKNPRARSAKLRGAEKIKN